MTDWRPIAALPEHLKDGRPVLLWTDWAAARERYGDSPTWRDEPVAARWRPTAGPEGGYWALTEVGAHAAGDEVNGQPSHYAEIEPPTS